MDMLIAAVLLPALGYLCGSVPVGYLAGRLRGIDIRQHGSRNVGATNVGRVLGKKWGLSVFALDVLKGAVPVLLAGLYLQSNFAPRQFWVTETHMDIIALVRKWDGHPWSILYSLWLLTAFAAIAGHIWPVWLKFKGGKGVATSLGVVLAIYPFFTWPGLIALGTWIVVTAIWRYVSLGSIVAAVAFAASLAALSLALGGRWSPGRIWPLLIFGGLMPLLVIWRHRTNISRLLAGAENKVFSRKKENKETQE